MILALTTDKSHSPPPLMGSPGDGTQRGLWVSHRVGLLPVVGASPTTLPWISHNSSMFYQTKFLKLKTCFLSLEP